MMKRPKHNNGLAEHDLFWGGGECPGNSRVNLFELGPRPVQVRQRGDKLKIVDLDAPFKPQKHEKRSKEA
eukprot:5734060-Amphidinium_carterae.1